MDADTWKTCIVDNGLNIAQGTSTVLYFLCADVITSVGAFVHLCSTVDEDGLAKVYRNGRELKTCDHTGVVPKRQAYETNGRQSLWAD